MIQCPICRQMIPDDSAFCDQCGKELMWCPECKRPKRGTQCPLCGSDLIPGHLWIKNIGGDGNTPPEKASPEKASPVIPSPSGASVSHPSKLVGSGGLILSLEEGPFGRRGGIWPELGTCQYVSGSHGVIGKAGGEWTITDNGSTNGTFVNGARLATGVATPLKAGDKVRIATLDFIVQ